eukprot:TRINITY_DN504_c0_g3_i1.p1 TRINITY_DN504_c0_g3~~TRINITY_DN504_c0_g3_i1.p1  ORF type:complete len:306 (+),score=87.61 TRINITY_DN504_c0_g3_i1:75-920(+)
MAAEAAGLHAACGKDPRRTLSELLTYLRSIGAAPLSGGDEEEAWVLEVLRATRAAGQQQNADELRKMPVTVTPGAQRAFERAQAEAKEKPKAAETTEIPIGTKCKRNGCKNVYEGPQSQEIICHYHPGAAIFHETYKYWSCCDTHRAWDWDDFQRIPPCRVGPETCAFTDEAAGLRKRAPCRHDFFQVGTGVTWSIYAKKVDPEKSMFMISPTHVQVEVHFDVDKVFRYHAKLSGRIEPEQCKIEIKEPKIEISLRKAADASGQAWEKLGEEIHDEEMAQD